MISVSNEYLQECCPHQNAYNEIMEGISSKRLFKFHLSTKSFLNEKTSTEKFLNEWHNRVKDPLELSPNDKTFLRTRIIELLLYGAEKGYTRWSHFAIFKKIIDVVNFESFSTSQPCPQVEQVYQEMKVDFACYIPFNLPRLNKLFQKYIAENKLLSKTERNFSKTKIWDNVLETSDNIKKINRLQGVIRSWNTQREILYPAQLIPAFEKHLLKNISLKLIRQICQTIAKLSHKKKLEEFNSIELSGRFKPIYHCGIRLLQQADCIHLFMTQLGIDELDNGEHKKILRSQKFSISLDRDKKGQRSIEYRRFVKIQYKNLDDPEDPFFDSSSIINRLSFLSPELHSTIPKREYFGVKICENHLESEPLGVYEPWYNSSLFNAVNLQSIPLDFAPDSLQREFSLKDVISCFIKIDHDLTQLHQLNIIHNDVKMQNMLCKVEDNGQVTACMTDYDLAGVHYKKHGDIIKDEKEYVYWDLTRTKLGIATPFSDKHGLAFSFLEALFPTYLDKYLKFNNCYLPLSFLISDQKELISDILKKIRSVHSLQFSDFYQTLRKMQKGVLFTTVDELGEILLNSFDSLTLNETEKEAFREIYWRTLAQGTAIKVAQDADEMNELVFNRLISMSNYKELFEYGSYQERYAFIEELSKKIPQINSFSKHLRDLYEKLVMVEFK